MPSAAAFRGAFSIIELVFVVSILGVLIFAIPSSLHLKEKSCYATLASSLSNLQEKLSNLYTTFTLNPASLNIMQETTMAILQSHNIDSAKNCSLIFSNNRLIARVGNERVDFSISPSDFSEQPAFKCNFTTSALCRKILERVKIR